MTAATLTIITSELYSSPAVFIFPCTHTESDHSQNVQRARYLPLPGVNVFKREFILNSEWAEFKFLSHAIVTHRRAIFIQSSIYVYIQQLSKGGILGSKLTVTFEVNMLEPGIIGQNCDGYTAGSEQVQWGVPGLQCSTEGQPVNQ